ncbi:MAG: ABC transporter ATP-binding protein [Candidatus Methanoplasma sp.]|jgi:zinc transport system ATP-binding protein|nr:ABC transporter ATP-binding protein [Candidatus Methanoplasma sp.]
MDGLLPLEIKGLSAGYGRSLAFESVDLELRDRDFLAVIGPNGGGKTTLFKVILGLVPPAGGSVAIFGCPPSEGARRIGYVPQRGMFDWTYPISVRDVVLMGMRSRKGVRPMYSGEHRALADEAMMTAGVADLSERKISDLSGGQLQRVLLARALAPKPEILMLDEPTASLDPSMTRCVHDVLRDVNRDVSIIMITHDLGALGRDVKRIACLNHRMAVSDTPKITPEMASIGFCCPPDLLSGLLSDGAGKESACSCKAGCRCKACMERMEGDSAG